MKITRVIRTATLLQVFASIRGKRFEFTSFQQNPFEVYDFPKSWKGLPRHCGWLSGVTGEKLRCLVAWKNHYPMDPIELHA